MATQVKIAIDIGEHEIESSPKDPTLGGNQQDALDINRMGKVQQFRRNFNFLSIVSFVSVLQGTWESVLLASSLGLNNGGTAGIIWMTMICWIGMLAMIASMAEMASMAPTAGGQYHWVSEFAPPSVQKPLSYLVGWYCCLGWVSGIPACAQILSSLTESMILLVHPEADIVQRWQVTLLIFLFLVLTFAFNVFCSRWLPATELAMLGLHVAGFLTSLVVLWVMGEHLPAKEVFTEFSDNSGWGNLGLSTLVGISSPLWFFIGPDGGAHLSEELRDASLTLPRAMMWSTFLNGLIGIAMLITFCFCLTDLEGIINTSTGQPIIQVLSNISNGSQALPLVLGAILLVLGYVGSVNNIAASARQIWAFARDNGLPCSTWIAHVGVSQRNRPLRSLFICAVISFALAAINFGSDVAFDAIIALSNAALVFSYIASIACLRWKRLRGEPLLPRRWDLGWLGAPINDFALAFLAVGFVFSFFPVAPIAGDAAWAADFNWAVVMFVGTAVLAMAYYYLAGGRDRYVAPVRLVKNE